MRGKSAVTKFPIWSIVMNFMLVELRISEKKRYGHFGVHCLFFIPLLAPKSGGVKKKTSAISKSQLERFFTRVVTPKPKPDVLPGKFLHLLNLSAAVSQVAEKMQKEVLARALF